MLGHHRLRERQLRKTGRRAFAKVLEVKRTRILDTEGDPSLVANTQRLWKLVLRVEPDGEPPFEAKIDAFFPQTAEPGPTADFAFAVLYDPSDHTKVLLDRSEEANRSLDALQSKQRVDERVSTMRSRGQDVIADRYQKIHDLGLVGSDNLPSDPNERKKQLAERRAKIKEIMGGESLGAQVLVGGQPIQPAAADPTAIAQALTKLADLRDRGLLTGQEFEAQKKKLLGE